MEYLWNENESLTLTSEQGRVVVPHAFLGPLRHLLAQGPPMPSGEADESKVAGEGKIAGKYAKGSGK